MARILLTVPPLTGHLNPALAAAHALERQGHTLAWAIHADQIGSKLPDGATIYPLDGGDEVPARDNLASMSSKVRGLESVRLFFEDYAMPLARRVLAPMEAAVLAFDPDVIVVDHQMPGGALIARKLKRPWVTLVTTSASILKTSPVFDTWVADQYRALQRPVLPVEAIVDRPDFSPHSVIVFSIEALLGTAHERVAAPYVFVGPPRGEGRQPVAFPWDWLQGDRRKILITLGTVSRDRDTRFFEIMMDALDQLPHLQAVMVAPETLAPRAPPNVLVRAYVPQTDLLDRVDAVICHAGHNTVCEALSRGLPMIVAPIRDDQPMVARQVIDAGAALFMRHGKVTVATAKALIERLLDDAALRVQVLKLARELHGVDGGSGAANIISSLARAAKASATLSPITVG